jgi:hypothetical protein
MIFQAQCPGCKNVMRIPADLLQRSLRCQHCQTIFTATASRRVDPGGAEGPTAGINRVAGSEIGGWIPHRQARRPAYELIFALLAIVVITAAYLVLARDGIPRPSSTLGLVLGATGFLLMLSTETLYSLRKRWPRFHFGPTSSWLRWHIVTGIVGPYLVLLHSGWKFHGLAGVLTLVVAVVVVSGFIGRYIYTAVPRTIDGAELAVRDLENRLATVDEQLEALGIQGMDRQALASVMEMPARGWRLVFFRTWLRWRQRRRLRRLLARLGPQGRARAGQFEELLAERFRWQLQIDSLAAGRRLLALWHVIHIPLGVVMFTLAVIHMGAALYFAAGLN